MTDHPEAGHVEDTVQKLADLHGEYLRSASPLQRLISRATIILAKPLVALAIALAAGGWVLLNAAAPRVGLVAWDPAPFAALETAATVMALVTTILILVAQRREDELARRRGQLTLQLASQSEQMIAKVIQLLEEQRRENPLLPNRPDAQADEMAQPSDPKRVLDRIIDSYRDAEGAS